MLIALSAKHGIFPDNESESVFYSSIRLAKASGEIHGQLKKMLHLIVGQTKERAVKYSKLVEDTRQYLSKNYQEKLSLSSIANYVHVSTNYLCRVFKNETGTSIMDTLNSIRIEKAKKLLESSDYKVADVACRVGINDPGYFTHVFCKYTGVSPKDYYNRFEKQT